MQTDGKSDFPAALRKLFHFVREPRSGEGDVAFRDAETVRGGHFVEEPHHVVVVVEGLAAPHQDDIRYGAGLHAAALRGIDRDHLAQDLRKSEVAHQSVGTRRAERAMHPAPHLRGDAEGVAVVMGHEDALNEVVVREGEKILFAAVAGSIDAHDGDGICDELFLQIGAQSFGERGHPVDVLARKTERADLPCRIRGRGRREKGCDLLLAKPEECAFFALRSAFRVHRLLSHLRNLAMKKPSHSPLGRSCRVPSLSKGTGIFSRERPSPSAYPAFPMFSSLKSVQVE